MMNSAESSKHPLPSRLSTELFGLAELGAANGLTFREIFDHLQGRLYPLLLVFIALPFCQPITIPGFSTPFGIVIVLLGLRFAFRRKPWLPKRLMDQRIPAVLLTKIFNGGAVVLRWLEKFLHPRVQWVFEWPLIQFATGIGIAASGILLLLPLPVPLSNLFPAVAVLFAAAAISERDGAMLIASVVVFVIAALYIGLIFLGGVELITWLNGLVFSRPQTP